MTKTYKIDNNLIIEQLQIYKKNPSGWIRKGRKYKNVVIFFNNFFYIYKFFFEINVKKMFFQYLINSNFIDVQSKTVNENNYLFYIFQKLMCDDVNSTGFLFDSLISFFQNIQLDNVYINIDSKDFYMKSKKLVLEVKNNKPQFLINLTDLDSFENFIRAYFFLPDQLLKRKRELNFRMWLLKKYNKKEIIIQPSILWTYAIHYTIGSYNVENTINASIENLIEFFNDEIKFIKFSEKFLNE